MGEKGRRTRSGKTGNADHKDLEGHAEDAGFHSKCNSKPLETFKRKSDMS